MKKVLFVGLLLTLVTVARSQSQDEHQGDNHQLGDLLKEDHHDLENDQAEFNDDKKDIDNDHLDLNDDHKDLLNDHMDFNDDHTDSLNDEKDFGNEHVDVLNDHEDTVKGQSGASGTH